ncbi:hypothetical protein L914_07175 [Phytophthora nicotianae]|uniref:Uncharacterized protein n=1 Tax=Phytophthora nicotianae TaxID=4792 RepID=W2NKT2_PHYNI|nr:hypothetical protein L914_07175 [Phytophthora nicotianae]
MYENGKYASKKLNAAYVKAQKVYSENVDAAMCSDNPKGIFSMYQSMMLLAASVIPHESPQNDALVGFLKVWIPPSSAKVTRIRSTNRS